MTREEAIDIIKYGMEISKYPSRLTLTVAEVEEAKQMAIKALEQEPTGNNWDCDWVKMTYEVDSFPKGIMFRFSDGTIKRVQTVEQTVQEPCDKCEVGNPCLYCKHDFEETAEYEPCDDAISRQAVLDAITTWDKFGCDADTKLVPYQDHYIPYIHYDDVIKCIKGMPSVQPKSETVTEFADRCRECGAHYGRLLKQKSGKWVEIDDEPHEVWECDHCGFVIDGSGCIDPIEYRDTYKFCPNCGADMRESEE